MSENTLSDRLPGALIEQVEELSVPELRALKSYVEKHIKTSDRPLETLIQESAAGEIVDIDADNDTSAIVRKHPPDPDGPGVDTDTVSIYTVRRQACFEGGEEVRWSYLGEKTDGDFETNGEYCPDCGHPLAGVPETCPHCGREVTQS